MEYIKEDNRIYMRDIEGKIVAEITYRETEKGVYNIDHTFVDESLRGQGVAKKLVEMAIEEIKNKKGKVQATCSYARQYLEKMSDK